jgi:DNA-binding NtrC family response regulator
MNLEVFSICHDYNLLYKYLRAPKELILMTLEQDKKSYTFILIDDEPGVLRALELLLKALGHAVISFSDSEIAIQYIVGRGFSTDARVGPGEVVILSDLKMPKKSGLDVLQARNQGAHEVRFILMSAHANEDDIEHAIREGAYAFLPKPFTPQSLFEALGAL